MHEQIIRKLGEESRRLGRIIRQAEAILKNAPSGAVSAKRHGKKVFFYYRKTPGEKSGVYMSADEKDKAILLIQRRYMEKVLITAKGQKGVVDGFLARFKPDAIAAIWEKEASTRRSFIKPVDLPDEEYARRWQAVAYEGLPFRDGAAEHYTKRQERVRSKSEVMIANALHDAGIPYRYEAPLQVGDRVVHPDFTILRTEDRETLYWEHLGLTDDAEYRHNAILKIHAYEKHGIFPGDRLILTAESNKCPLNAAIVDLMIRHHIRQG